MALTGPWFLRSAVVFGDALGTTTHLAMPWARAEALSLSVALNQVPGTLNSWWLSFGWGNIIAPAWIYLVLDVLMLLGLARRGLLGELLRTIGGSNAGGC